MPALTDLDSRIASDPSWQSIYERNLLHAEYAAANMHLVHVSGHFMAFEELFASGCLEIPTSDASTGYCSETARASEQAHGLKSSAYFYAGRACPEFGPVALAFPPECEKDRKGSATPYDTGGLFCGCIRWSLPDYDPATLAKFTEESIFDLKNWRVDFKKYLAAFFHPLQAYWSGRPWQDDPDGLFQAPNSWRAWVFEVRFDKGPDWLSASAWCARPDQADLLYEAAEQHPPLGSQHSHLQLFIETVLELMPGGSPYYCEEIEDWVRREVRLS
ncbi:MAG TPA: hypothetical protein VN643_01180 [Pyrinomonadaceae bacterium]|nr:hypothetical protein [Pyrinomonadaceae bacterium]